MGWPPQEADALTSPVATPTLPDDFEPTTYRTRRCSDGGARDIHVEPEIQRVFSLVFERRKVRFADMNGRISSLFQ